MIGCYITRRRIIAFFRYQTLGMSELVVQMLKPTSPLHLFFPLISHLSPLTSDPLIATALPCPVTSLVAIILLFFSLHCLFALCVAICATGHVSEHNMWWRENTDTLDNAAHSLQETNDRDLVHSFFFEELQSSLVDV